MWRYHVPSFDTSMSPLPWDWSIANKSDHINFRRRLAWKGPMWSGANSYVILILALPAMYALLVGFKYYWIFRTYILRSDSAVCSNNYFALYGNFYVPSQRLLFCIVWKLLCCFTTIIFIISQYHQLSNRHLKHASKQDTKPSSVMTSSQYLVHHRLWRHQVVSDLTVPLHCM